MKTFHKPLRVLAMLLSLLLLCGCGAQEAAQPGEPAPTETAAPTPEATETPAETPEPAPTPVPTAEPRVVSVSTVDELLDAIAPNTCIELAPGVYDFSAASDYGKEGTSPYYAWVSTLFYNEVGYGLEIHDVDGLTIRGAGRGVSFLNALPRYVFVITFRNCSGVSVHRREGTGLRALRLRHRGRLRPGQQGHFRPGQPDLRVQQRRRADRDLPGRAGGRLRGL